MKTMTTVLVTLVVAIIAQSTIYTEREDKILEENIKLKSMVNIVVEYADSTMDTGEFDEFCQSNAGQNFFKKYDEINKGE